MLQVSPPRAQNPFELAGTFAGLMDLYERNYIGLRRLVPCWPEAPQELLSTAGGALPLHLEISDRFPFTSDLVLTYVFEREGKRKHEPNLHIRVYHDARQAEVTAAHLRHWPSFDTEQCSELWLRWRANRFLYKWLMYCLHQGHRFELAPSTLVLPLASSV